MTMKLFQYHTIDGTPIPAIIQPCMDAWRQWCAKNSVEYILVEEPRVDSDTYIETASDHARVRLLSEHAPAMWADWDTVPLEGFAIPDLARQWAEKPDYAILYSPDTAVWQEIGKRLKDYYATHPLASRERGRMWKIINAYTEYQPLRFEGSTYKHLLYHNFTEGVPRV